MCVAYNAMQKEKEKNKEVTPEPEPEVPDKDKAEGKDMIDEAKKTVAALAKENEIMKAHLEKQERLMAEQALSGQADGSVPKKEKTEDEKWKEDAKKRYDGTGMDPTE